MNPLLAVMPGCTVPSPFAGAAVLALCVAVVGQQPQQQPAPMPTLPGAQQGQQGQPGNGRQGTAEQQGPVIDPRPRDPIDPTWTRLQQSRQFQGFPVFPTRLSGYGAYPSSGTPPSGFVPVLPPAGPEVADWPGWLRLRGREALPYSPEVALLVRHTDRVWWRRDTDEAFVPLFFHDKIGALRVGSEVQVRQAGEFELLLHTSGRIIALGPTDLRVETLDETAVVVDVRAFTHLRLHAGRRATTLQLPDRSRLTLPAPAADAVDAGPTTVLFHRAEEPGFYGGRATIFNAGPRDVVLAGAFGETTLPSGQRLTIFLSPPATAVPATVDAGEAIATMDGDTLRLDAPQGGTVSWCGARFTLEAGCSVRFVPLQGQPFDQPSASGPAKTP